MNIMRFIAILFSAALLLTCISCEKESEPSGPCDDNDWARVTKNGEEACLGYVEVNYFNANTSSAKIVFTAGNEMVGDKELMVDFAIPIEGVALNTPYPVEEGRIYGADPITEGSITLLVFDPPSQGKAGCIAGTFELTASGPDSPVPFEYTNGKFTYYKSAATDVIVGTPCNPFK